MRYIDIHPSYTIVNFSFNNIKITFLEFFEGLIGCAIKYNNNMALFSSAGTTIYNKPKSATSITQIIEITGGGLGQFTTTASRPSSKSQYMNSKSESKVTDYPIQGQGAETTVKTAETNGI